MIYTLHMRASAHAAARVKCVGHSSCFHLSMGSEEDACDFTWWWRLGGVRRQQGLDVLHHSLKLEVQGGAAAWSCMMYSASGHQPQVDCYLATLCEFVRVGFRRFSCKHQQCIQQDDTQFSNAGMAFCSHGNVYEAECLASTDVAHNTISKITKSTSVQTLEADVCLHY